METRGVAGDGVEGWLLERGCPLNASKKSREAALDN